MRSRGPPLRPAAQSAQNATEGRGPHYPLLREEQRAEPHPEVPSIDEPPRFGRRTFVRRVTSAGCSPQIVTSLWRALGALFIFDTVPALTTDTYEDAFYAVAETDRGPLQAIRMASADTQRPLDF